MKHASIALADRSAPAAPAGSRNEPAGKHPFRHGSRQLYGGFDNQGFNIDWHAFETPELQEWSPRFPPKCLELCLNLAGHGAIRCGGGAVALEPLTGAFYIRGQQSVETGREPNQSHRFVTFQFSQSYLREQLASCDGALEPLVEKFVRGTQASIGAAAVRKLTGAQEQRLGHLVNPPVPHGARELWYRGVALELMADFFFERQGEDELFCDRQKRIARERAERVAVLLRRNLVEPLSLEKIGREVGCSPFHLSRTFSRQMGMTIPQYLRKLRMERAAELLRSGTCNVTEAAMEVGYASLSHFSQAFCQTMGCCPGLYPLKKRV